MKNAPPIIAFTGPSGSGKTTLIEKLIARLAREGVRVGAIKRSHHRIDIDREGKDSHRFREAGANPVVITGGSFIGWMEKSPATATLEELRERFTGKADIIIVEGFKGEAVPRFVFAGETPALPETGVVGIITAEPASGASVFHRDDVDAVAAWIMRNLL